MTERAVAIGADRGLVGILSEPEDAASGGRPAVIMLNAGLIHRVGPNRLHVRLARRLEAAGFVAVRLDLSGRGDSEPRRDGLSFVESGMLETAETMTYLESTKGIRRFVLVGICSGAFTAGQVAYGDRRVVGAVIIEGAAFPTRRFFVRYYGERLFRKTTWLNTFTGANGVGRRIRGMLGRPIAVPAQGDMMDGLAIPELSQAVTAVVLQQMADRPVDLLTMFSGSTKEYNYEGQLRAAFPTVDFRGRLDEAYYPRADHTFTRLREQEALVNRILAWMTVKFAEPVHDAGPGDDLVSASMTEDVLL
ncbi:MAG: alpha/beta fold hydrolase [Acidobacteriota bacterium]